MIGARRALTQLAGALAWGGFLVWGSSALTTPLP
jgi:hypothetical protein